MLFTHLEAEAIFRQVIIPLVVRERANCFTIKRHVLAAVETVLHIYANYNSEASSMNTGDDYSTPNELIISYTFLVTHT